MRETEYGVEFEAEVVESRALTPSAHHIRVTRPDGWVYQPVQYTFLSLRTEQSDDFSDYRPMSLASSPTRDHLEYGARLSDSPWKRAFERLEPGDTVLVEGPAGHFILDERRPAVMLAGGIGITPLKGMVEYATDRGLEIPVELVYSNRSVEEIAYREELDAAASANPRLSITHTLTRQAPDGWDGRTGRIDDAGLGDLNDRYPDAVWYICGTPGMVQTMTRSIVDMGVDDKDVRYEQFWGY